MTHRERAITALKGGIPDFVPTFELVFYETGRDFDGRVFYGTRFLPADGSSDLTLERICKKNAGLYIDVARRFEHSIIYVTPFGYPPWTDMKSVRLTVTEIREQTGDEFCIMTAGDPTLKIPQNPMAFVTTMYDEPEKLKAEAQSRLDAVIPVYDMTVEIGADGIVMTSDYAMNSGPFLSPDQFAEFVTPYLTGAIQEIHDRNLLAIKHTDGNLMPVMDQIAGANPDGLHSVDPMAGMDIKVIKEQFGSRMCLCGNVHTAWLQTGTPEQIRKSAEYCLEHGKPGGGYIFCTSNCVFRGMPLESYDLIHSIWMAHRDY